MNRILSEISAYRKKSKERRERGVFLVEGVKMLSEVPEDRVLKAVASESFAAKNPDLLNPYRPERLILIPDADFHRISETETPQGILAIVKQYDYSLSDVISKKDGLYVFADTLQDPGNAGTLFRSAEAAGADGLVFSRGSADLYNPKVIRSTMGSVFRMKFTVVEDMKEAIRAVHALGGHVYAAALTGAKDYAEASYQGCTAILIGNESKGLPETLVKEAGESVFIPMEGKVESLNAAMAATILLYEAHEKRRKGVL